jgi:predicted DsbA family dithiol-disulfide isomerase
MQVEIYSDVVCPWCAIGKAKFEIAVQQFVAEGGEPIEVVWRPFQLDPTAPSTPSPVLDVYAKKFGGPEKAKQITEHVTNVAASVGWTFDFSIAQRANTFDAHRLLAFALESGGAELQGRIKNALLRAYFTEGRNVGDPDELVAIGVAEGLDGDAVRAMLASGDYVRVTREEMDRAVELGISAVPSFVFNGVGVLPGAQDPEQFLRVLRRLASR